MASYDKHYLTEDLFGEPYPELITFFDQYPARGHLLDMGCGQGRDALALARLGYSVTGVDISKVGIQQMMDKASSMGLNVQGVVGDFHTYTPEQPVDGVLFNSVLHFAKERAEEEAFLSRLAPHIKPGGIICICLRKSAPKEKLMRRFFTTLEGNWGTLHETYLDYEYVDKETDHRSKTTYLMFITQKQTEE